METQVEERGIGQLLVSLVIVTLLLAIASVATVYFPLYAALPLCILLPTYIALTRWDIGYPTQIKLLTLVTGTTIILFGYLAIIPGHIIGPLFMWMLRLNIIEAIGKDILIKNYFNILSGLIVLFATAFFSLEWSGVYIFTLPTTILFWIIAYSIWNWNFVNHTFDESITFYHLGVLAIPFIAAIVAFPGIWIMTRSASLTLGGVLQIMAERKVTNTFQNKKFAAFTQSAKKMPAEIAMTSAVAAFVLIFLFVTI